jgi:hypothetical protein
MLHLKKLKSIIILLFARKENKLKTSSKITIYVMTQTPIFEKKLQNNCKEKMKHGPKSSILREEMNIRSLIK